MVAINSVDNVKKTMNLTIEDGDFDISLQTKIIAVEMYLKNAGASEETIKSQLGLMFVSVGVNDLLNQGSGETKFSPAFTMLANQICR